MKKNHIEHVDNASIIHCDMLKDMLLYDFAVNKMTFNTCSIIDKRFLLSTVLEVIIIPMQQ